MMIWLVPLVLPLVPVILLLLCVLLLSTQSKKWHRIRRAIDDQHILITGGSQGIGLALAKEVASRGANVTILARNVAQLNVAKIELEKLKKNPDSQKINAISCDVGKDYDTVQNAIRQAVTELGEVNMLVNCAGFARMKYFQDIPISEFKALMDVNYYGSVYATKAVIESMVRRKQGSILFVSSQGGLCGIIGMTSYSPTKYAIRGFAEALRMEMLPFNISVSVVYPPDTDTPGFVKENVSKPVECAEISETSGLFQPEHVAKRIVEDALQGKFSITIGLDGFMLDAVTSGLTPFPGVVTTLLQVPLVGIFRIIGLFYSASFEKIVMKHSNKRKS